MLKKLIKYEWKAVRNILLMINAFTVFSTILGAVAMIGLVPGEHTEEIFPIAVLLFMAYYATIVGVSFAMMIYIGIRFYRNLYTDEGYLMHTLPVTGRQLVLSKLIVHGGCMLLTTALIYASIGILICAPSVTERFSVSYAVRTLLTECSNTLGISLPTTLLCAAVSFVISLASGILAIYCAISLGQMFRRHKIIGSILCYIAILCLIQTLMSVLLMPQMLLSMSGEKFNTAVYFNSVFLTSGVISLFLGIVFYLITLHLMNKKLNLD